MNRKTIVGLIAVAVLLVVALTARMVVGTRTNGDAKQQRTAAQANEIAARSGGNWDNLSPTDKQFMLKLSYGNQQSAKQMLFALSGRTYEGTWGKPGPRPPVRPAFANQAAAGSTAPQAPAH